MQSKSFTDTVIMIRPRNFGSNPETLSNNFFQNEADGLDASQVQNQAIEEFDLAASTLKENDIEVLMIEDTETPAKFDAVFPNNWFSTHHKKCIVSYPMYSKNRRLERREELLKQLQKQFGYKKRYAFEYHEDTKEFLEGTGSMILDRDNRIAYCSLSPRSHIVVLEKFAVLLGYRKLIFHARDENDKLIYHTNVMMSLGNGFVIVCLEAIKDEEERKILENTLTKSGKTIIDINYAQLRAFAGNAIQLKSKLGELIYVMSDTAYSSLNINQLDAIMAHSRILTVNIPTIQKIGGGGIRCMLAEIF